MSTTEKILGDLVVATEDAKAFIGEFVYAPFGIESTPLMNSATLYVCLGILAMVTYRISRPAPQRRYRQRINEYGFGRNV